MGNSFGGTYNDKIYPREAPLVPSGVYNFVLSANTEATCAIPAGAKYLAISATYDFHLGFGSSAISLPSASGAPDPVAYKNVTTIDLSGITTSNTLRIISDLAQTVQAQFYE